MRFSPLSLAVAVLLCSCARNYVVKHSQVDESRPVAAEPESSAPSEASEAEDRAAPAPGAAPAAAPAPAPDSDIMEYTTVQGDTLERIAAAHLGWSKLGLHLKEWNKRPEGIRDPLPAGARILIPLRFKVLAGARASATVASELRPVKPPLVRRIARGRLPSDVFKVGEALSFDVKWHGITAGRANLALAPMETVGGSRCWHIIARARSRLVFFFKVEDSIESYCTEDDLLPARFEKHLREGRYKKDLVATFDRARHAATWGQLDVPLAADCRDLLGAFYYFRTIPLPAAGNETDVCIHTDKTNYPMAITVLRRESVKVPAGEFKTVLIRPRLKFEGLWRQRGDVLIWLTDDAARVPVLVQSKVHLLGSVDVVLTRVERVQ